MIETRLLQYFLIVAQEKNITNASKILHITQPTLSRQMSLLEREIGVALFEKGSRPLKLTNEGVLLRRRAEEILNLIQKAEQEALNCEAQVEGTVSIGCGELASVRLLSEILASFRIKYSHVAFDLYTANADDIKRSMDDGLTDIGLLLEPVDMERYEYIRMPLKERWAVLVPAGVPLAKREYITAKDLADIPVILPKRQKIHDEAASWFGRYYHSLKIASTSNMSTNAAVLVCAGIGYALTLEGSLPFLKEEEIRMVPLYPELLATSALAWRRQQPRSPAVTKFIEYFKCSLSMNFQ